MGYTKFCNGYADHTIANNLTNHLEHKPGVITEVDWSGPGMSYVDTSTGEVVKVNLFVGTLPYSQYSVYCKIKVPKVAEQKWTLLQVHFGHNCKALYHDSMERCCA
jgi:hypothetical protein